jgi:prophage regulatory protein
MSEVQHSGSRPAKKPRCRPQQPLHAVQIADALLRVATVVALTGLSRSTIYERVARDDSFPRPIRMGLRCTRFRAADVQAWLASRGR